MKNSRVMRMIMFALSVASGALLSLAAAAQDVTIPQEYGKIVKSAEVVGALGTDLFGDQTNFYTGSTEFTATDVSLPGKGLVPVALGRRYEVKDKTGAYGAAQTIPTLPFGDWELDIPRLHGVFGKQTGWASSYEDPAQRCSVLSAEAAAPPYLQGGQGGVFAPSEYWHGNSLYIPGIGDQEMMVVTSGNPHKPTDGKTYRWVTQQQWYFSCLPKTASNNGVAGEAFLAIAPDGTRYWFDWIVSHAEPQITKPVGMPPIDGGSSGTVSSSSSSPAMQSDDVSPMAIGGSYLLRRVEVSILPTRIEDRFGNAVVYTYDTVNKSQLKTIEASDGRRIDLTWNTSGHVTMVSTGTRTWTYGYSQSGNVLQTVTLPDLSRWQYAIANLGAVHAANDLAESDCWSPPSNPQQSTYTGSITHPSGAVGTFTFKPTLHGRSYVYDSCVGVIVDDHVVWYALHPVLYDGISIISKRIEGPGISTPYNWTFTYGAPNNSWAKDCPGSSCIATKTVETMGPSSEWTRYTFSNKYRQGEGKLLKTETGTGPSNILRTTTTSYLLNPANQAFPARIGASPYARGDHTAEQHAPTLQRQISQQGTTFTWQMNQTGGAYAFDVYANPLSVTRSSSVGLSKTDVSEYNNNTSKWVLGQVKKLTTNSIEVSRADYHAVTALPTATYAFGKLKNSLYYYADGTLKQVKDGNNNVTTFSNWKRGIPQTITYPATPDQPTGATKSAAVNDSGWITSVTDENSYKTCYEYDEMGRVTKIIYPSESAVNTCAANAPWAVTTQVFEKITVPEYNIPAGHWRQTTLTGTGRKLVYFDAFWRPLISREDDTAQITATRRVTRYAYDAIGRPVFTSFPVADGIPGAAGTTTTYDALGRVTQVSVPSTDSTTGTFKTTTSYLNNASGPYTLVTDPRGNQTRTWFQMFDQPDYSRPITVWHPAGTYTDISRDVFGKPLSVTRRNSAATIAATRYWMYDDNQRLCKSIEDETGTTTYEYDNAGNLTKTNFGIPLTTPSLCSTTAFAAPPTGGGSPPVAAHYAVRSYDARNRIKSLVFPDHLGDITYSYTPDSQLASLTADNGGSNQVTTQYTYNHRRLMTLERELWGSGGINWPITYVYNSNGHLSAQNWHGLNITYVPNALGQPTQVGTYATGVSYHPNGGIAQFTYGNGIVHTMTQNDRQLPDTSRDVYGSTKFIDDGYDFDGNGNVAAISDGLPGNYGNRDMTYDGLDRLKTTTSKWFSLTGTTVGTASYTYDVLDNLTRVVMPTTPAGAARDHYYCYDAKWRLTNVKTTSCSGATVIGLGYDDQGNLANKNGMGFVFDFGNRLRSAATTPASSYVYDGHGRRVRDYVGASKYSQYNSKGELLQVSDGRTGKFIEYFYLQGSLVASRERDTTVTPNVYTVKYQHTDALGSPVAVTNQARAVLETNKYEPYGKVLNHVLVDGPGYTGHVADAATGLNYMQQRYYDPTIGRFLSVDPVTANPKNGSNFNRYWYANNNPYKFIDPDGRLTCNGSAGDCKKVDQYVDKIKESKNAPGIKPGEAKQIQKVITYLGKKGEGPTVTPTALPGDTKARTDQRGNIKIDVDKNPKGADATVHGAMALSHEAQHDVYAQSNGEAHTREAATASEKSAYGVEALVGRGLGVSLSPAALDAAVQKSVNNAFGPPPEKPNENP